MSVFLDDGDVQLHHGDVIQTLRELPAGIAQTCVTSPPYWGLRDYGTGEWSGGDSGCDHLGEPFRTKASINANCGTGADVKNAVDRQPMGASCSKCGARRVDSQLGLEATPDLYVERLVAVFREVWRVLRADGTVWLNLGDSYNAQPKGNTKPRSEQGNGSGRYNLDSGQSQQHWQEQGHRSRGLIDGLKPKDLVGVPWRVAFALQADGWYLRSDIVWSKPNPMPESVTDRPTKAHEYLFLLSKRPRYFYDADAVREPHTWGKTQQRLTPKKERGDQRTWTPPNGEYLNPAGRNRRSVWTIATEPFPEAHFATYPQALVRPCILAGTSEGACDRCGAPFERVASDGRRATGWRSSCSCSPSCVYPIAQTVLDPFIGSGTTALVARNHGRRCIGIDLSAEYLAIAAKRLQQLSLLAGMDTG